MSLKSYFKTHKLIICNYDYDVNYIRNPRAFSGQEILLGEVDLNRQCIKLSHDLSAEQELSTLLHESIHAIDHHLQIGLSEKNTRRLECGLHALLRANPILCQRYSEGTL